MQRVFLRSSLGNTGQALCQPSILNTTKAETVSLTTSPGPRVWDIFIEYTSTACRRAIFGYTMTDITKLQGLTSCNKIKSSAYVTIHPIGSDLHRWYYLNTRAFIKYICQLCVTITKHLRELTYINQKFNQFTVLKDVVRYLVALLFGTYAEGSRYTRKKNHSCHKPGS